MNDMLITTDIVKAAEACRKRNMSLWKMLALVRMPRAIKAENVVRLHRSGIGHDIVLKYRNQKLNCGRRHKKTRKREE